MEVLRCESQLGNAPLAVVVGDELAVETDDMAEDEQPQ